jgi:aminoglycoside phosphotransferase (APT) family kinase protein
LVSEESVSEIRGVRYAAVLEFFRANVPDASDVAALEFELIGDGRSNITYRVSDGERSWVLRRPPLGHVLPTAHDMAREFRVIAALADSEVPVPRALALCEDPSVNDAPFYVMEYTPGVIVTGPRLPDGFAETPAECRAMSLGLVDTLVALHAIDPDTVGLGTFGRPQGYVERQVKRWSQQWERSSTGPLPEIRELMTRLRAALPDSPAPAIVHGDYRLGNLALDARDPSRVIAVFDWEMATLGDPLADLGYTLIYWADPGESAEMLRGVASSPGMLTRAEIVAAYAERSGRDVAAVDFYQVLALYKLAIISEGIYARFIAGQTLGDKFKGTTRHTGALARRALEIADASADEKLRG